MARTKVIITGPKSSGKTCLAHILTKKSFPDSYVPIVFPTEVFVITDGPEKHEIVLETVEESELRSVLGKQDVHVILLCVDVNNNDAISTANHWVTNLRALFDGARVILVGTKCDLRQPNTSLLARSYDDAMAARLGTTAYVECSALTNSGIPDLIKAVIEHGVTKVTPTFVSKITNMCLIQ